MKFNKIYLYNVPFDNSYENVVDIISKYNFNGTKDEFNYDIIFRKILPFITTITARYINLGVFKSVNLDSNKRCSVVFEHQQELDNYNYVVLLEDNKVVYFGFIESYFTTGNTTRTLITSRDVWFSNLYEISKNSNIRTLQNILSGSKEKNHCILKKGHLTETYVYNDKVNNYYYNPNMPNVNNKITNVTPVKDNNILWLKCLLTDNYPLSANGRALKIVYIPLGVLNENNKLDDCVIRVRTMVYDEGNSKFIDIIRDVHTSNNIRVILSNTTDFVPYIVSAKLTFNTPFRIEHENDYYEVPNSNGYTNYIPLGNFHFTTDEIADIYEVNTPIGFTSVNVDLIEEEYEVSSVHDKNIDYFSLDLPRERYSSPIFKTFPFNYKMFRSSDYSKILFNKNTIDKFLIEIENDIEVNGIKIYDIKKTLFGGEENVINEEMYNRISTTNEVSYGTDVKEYFLLTQGSQFAISTQLSMISSFMSGLTSASTLNIMGTGKGIIDILGKQESYNATLRDKERTPDTVKTSMNRGEVDLYYNDLYRIIDYSFIEDNTTISIDDDLFFYGVDYDVNVNPFSNSKISFDYLMCNEINIILGIDAFDTLKLKNIFKKGVTKNHIIIDDINNQQTIVNSKDTFSLNSKDLYNYDAYIYFMEV